MPVDKTNKLIGKAQDDLKKLTTTKFLQVFDEVAENHELWKQAKRNPREFFREKKILIPEDIDLRLTEEKLIPPQIKELISNIKVIIRCFWVCRIIKIKPLPNGRILPRIICYRVCRVIRL